MRLKVHSTTPCPILRFWQKPNRSINWEVIQERIIHRKEDDPCKMRTRTHVFLFKHHARTSDICSERECFFCWHCYFPALLHSGHTAKKSIKGSLRVFFKVSSVKGQGPLFMIDQANYHSKGMPCLNPAVWIWDVTLGAIGMKGLALSLLLLGDITIKKWDGVGARSTWVDMREESNLIT